MMASAKVLLGSLLAVLSTTVAAQSSTCPFNYPPLLRNTEANHGLIFTIASNNPATNNRAVQLRPAPFIDGGFFGGVDESSAVLLANLRDGGLYMQARTEFNQLYDLGPTGYINQRDEVGTLTRYSFVFANASIWPGYVEEEWEISGSGSMGFYGLYHQTENEIAHGFLLCEADIDLENGPWKQLFYQRYTDFPTDIPGCESVGVSTTVAPFIENGLCDLPSE